MSAPTPSYTFVTAAGQRRFVHRWHFENNKVIECNKCSTTCRTSDAYSQHWLQQKLKLNEVRDELNSWQRTAIMERQADIVSHNIESFMLCEGKVVSDTQQFLLDAGITAIPDLLNVLFATDGCKELVLKLRFYVEIEDEMFMLQSSDLEIKHYNDIRESVDVIFLMLLEKLRTFMTGLSRNRRNSLQDVVYRIRRIHIQTQRRYYIKEERVQLPLQYRRKHALVSPQEMPSESLNDLTELTQAFKNHLNSTPGLAFQPPFPCNLYCFQTCPNSLELYAVPYHISSKQENLKTIRSFIICHDSLGGFQQLQEIANIKRFLHHSQGNGVLCCSQCPSTFMEALKMSIHKKLNCGKNFEISKINQDDIEIYEKCWELMRCPQFLLYGIVE